MHNTINSASDLKLPECYVLMPYIPVPAETINYAGTEWTDDEDETDIEAIEGTPEEAEDEMQYFDFPPIFETESNIDMQKEEDALLNELCTKMYFLSPK